jgi:hypothetical protein
VISPFLKRSRHADLHPIHRLDDALAWPQILRDTLLPKLISGEVRVPDVERFAGEVLP